MHTKLAAALAVMALLGGCAKKDRDTGALKEDRAGVDTVVKSGAVKDTTVVKSDTNIDVDTLKKTEHIEKKN
jgi:type IV pilus biogenesis protein CpaD/CtpE